MWTPEALCDTGANLNELMQLSASYVDKLVKGAKPSDLPIEQPTKFEFLINMKTAKELGLTISRSCFCWLKKSSNSGS